MSIPVTTGDQYTLAAQNAVIGVNDGVLSNDDDATSARLIFTTGYGKLGFNPDGSFTYNTYDPAYNGPDNFIYRAANADGESIDTLVTINANSAPVSQGDIFTVETRGPVVVTAENGLLKNDTFSGDATVAKVFDTAYGATTLNPDGSFSYTPYDANFHGTDLFTYKTTDQFGTSQESLVRINVDAEINQIYRFYDTKSGNHFYTTDDAEAATVSGLANFKLEGIAAAAPDKGADTTDVFRFFNTTTGDHFYTASVSERDTVLATSADYKYEGVAFEAYTIAPADGQGDTMERFYNTKTGSHFYTADDNEIAALKAGAAGVDFKYEGAAFVIHTPGDGALIA